VTAPRKSDLVKVARDDGRADAVWRRLQVRRLSAAARKTRDRVIALLAGKEIASIDAMIDPQ
jgi:hypothetical protein